MALCARALLLCTPLVTFVTACAGDDGTATTSATAPTSATSSGGSTSDTATSDASTSTTSAETATSSSTTATTDATTTETSGATGTTETTGEPAASFVHNFEGATAVGPEHAPILLKGANLWAYNDDLEETEQGWYIWSSKIFDAASLAEIKGELCMNTVRLNLDFRTFEEDDAPYDYKPEGWAWLDERIAWAKDQGVYVILDMHAPPGGYQSFGFSGEFWGGGAAHVANRDRLKALWTAIAARYADEATIAAFDLINEPLPQSTQGYFDYMQELIDAIRTVDGNHMILVEEAFNDGFSWQTLDEANLAYDTHFYNPWSYVTQTDGGVTYPSGTLNADTQEQDLLDYGLQFAIDHGIAFNVGEYGMRTYLSEHPELGPQEYMDDLHDLLESYGVGSQIWSYHAPDWGIYHNSLGELPSDQGRNAFLFQFFQAGC